jgi:predicted metal-dependent peptidase
VRFIMSSTRGNDEYTWRKFNKRQVANDLYLPSIYNETLGEVVIAIDTSGSIGTGGTNRLLRRNWSRSVM